MNYSRDEEQLTQRAAVPCGLCLGLCHGHFYKEQEFKEHKCCHDSGHGQTPNPDACLGLLCLLMVGTCGHTLTRIRCRRGVMNSEMSIFLVGGVA